MRTEFGFDALDRQSLSRMTADPLNLTELRRYDKADNLIEVRQRSGLVRTLNYDLLNRHFRKPTSMIPP